MNVSTLYRKIKNDKGITLAATWSFNQLAYAIVYPFIPLYLAQERAIAYTTVSLIFPLMGLAVSLAPLPCGWMTDKFGRSFMMLFGQAGRAAIFFALAVFVYFNAPFWLFAIFLMLNSAVGVAFQVGADAYLADITTPEERPQYYSKIRIGYNVGWALGPMLGAFFAKTPFWLFFFITGILCIAGTIYTKLACFRYDTGVQSSKSVKEKTPDDFSIVNNVLKNFNFMMLLTGTLLLMLLASQLYSTLSAYSTQRVEISKEALGSIYSLNGFMVLALQIPIVAILKKLKVPVLIQLVSGTMIYAVSYFFIGFAAGAAALAVSVAAITLGEIVVQPALYTAVSSESKGNYAGRMLSMYSLMRGIGYSVGPWFGAMIFESTKSGPVLWGILSMFAVCSAIVFALTGKSKTQQI
ncbi:MAG: MFS transporter [Lentisphaeria bacterium]|nr:MFS transporter [Lentisphaeria bacterium]